MNQKLLVEFEKKHTAYLKDVKERKTSLELTESQQKKLELLLNNINIEEYNDETIVISSPKNIVFSSDKNIVSVAKEAIVLKSSIIHLNPLLSVKSLFSRIMRKLSLKELGKNEK